MTRDAHHRPGSGRRQERVTLAVTLALLAVCVSAPSRASAQTGELSADRRVQMEAAIAAFLAANKVPGLSVAVVQGGAVAWSAGFGMADLENAVPATAQTVYRIGSISKALTGVAAMALWEQRTLNLDAPVRTYCPAFPEKPWPITTRQLLGHLGGIRYYKVPELPYTKSQSDPEVGNTRHFEDGIAAGLQFFAGEPLVAQPGTRFSYSTQGYTLASCAMEGASSEKYADAVNRTVLVPAGMTQTRPDDRHAIVPFRTRFYSTDTSGAQVNAEFLDSSYKVAGGGWLSTAPDLARFAVAVLSDRLVTRATRDAMWTEQIPTGGLGRMAYGLGWQFGTIDGIRIAGHGGSQQGTSAMMLTAPEAGAAVVVLTNADGVGASRLAAGLMRLALGLPARVAKTIAVDPQVYQGLVGTYGFMDTRLAIVREGDRLVVEVGGGTFALLPETVRDYVVADIGVDVTFLTDGTGRARELLVHEGGTDLYLGRIE